MFEEARTINMFHQVVLASKPMYTQSFAAMHFLVDQGSKQLVLEPTTMAFAAAAKMSRSILRVMTRQAMYLLMRSVRASSF